MSILEEKDKNTTEATESEKLTLEDLDLDISEPSITFTATLHFEFSDIFNAIEHIETESNEEPASEPGPEPEAQSEPEDEPEPALDAQPESVSDEEPEPVAEPEEEAELTDAESTDEPESEPEIQDEPETETELEPESEIQDEPPKPKHSDRSVKKLVLVDAVLLVIIIASIIGGLVAANALVKQANEAKMQKITAVQENIKEVDLSESLRAYAADEVLKDIKVPTYTLDQLYQLDLREKTGFTEEDLKIITTRGLVGCEKAFVEAEEKYGVNSIFLVSIASLESAYGTQMFRPNNMFGYGRTGFSSKSECIMTVAKGLGTRYLQPGASLYGGSPTLKGVNKRYAANPQWYYKVGKYMQRYYNELAAAKNGNVEKFE